MIYSLRNLVKSYDGLTVLDLKRLDLEKGRVIGLLGPNGSGKTTLLEILAFLRDPSRGDVWYENEKVDFSLAKLTELRRKVVLVQQQPILFTTTVLKNIEFPLKIRRVPKVERRRLMEELLELVRMDEFKHARAAYLSGGETQRVAIARALACFPEVILLDEPTASVDVENQIAIDRIIGEINREKGISVIFTTHNMIQASRLADETVFLFKGKQARSIHENIFSGHIEEDKQGHKYCILANGLRLKVEARKSGSVQVSIDSNTLKISREKNSTPDDNTFKGKLVQLTDEIARVRALVDVAIPLSVLIPKDRSLQSLPGLGEDVWITCPVESIEVF
ncbi:MAG: ATP-binding cassette domain-containing protein [Desulfobacterales bacterium]|nr:ATP-binding cassette domain-containing protein [Desulfobacterales bacterium]